MKKILGAPFSKQSIIFESTTNLKSLEFSQKIVVRGAENQTNDRIDSKNSQEALSKAIDMKLLKMFESIKKEVIKELTTKSYKMNKF